MNIFAWLKWRVERFKVGTYAFFDPARDVIVAAVDDRTASTVSGPGMPVGELPFRNVYVGQAFVDAIHAIALPGAGGQVDDTQVRAGDVLLGNLNAPSGYAWFCTSEGCGMWATLGGNAAFHRSRCEFKRWNPTALPELRPIPIDTNPDVTLKLNEVRAINRALHRLAEFEREDVMGAILKTSGSQYLADGELAELARKLDAIDMTVPQRWFEPLSHERTPLPKK